MKRLVEYFSKDVTSVDFGSIGMEVETQFLDDSGNPVTTAVSQSIFSGLLSRGWMITGKSSNLITCIESNGNTFTYELGRHNIELSTCPSKKEKVLDVAPGCLDDLYRVAYLNGARPLFAPVLDTDEDLLVIPDERDAVWLALDGRGALAPLARTSSIQFTVAVSPGNAISCLNKLGKNIDWFLRDYPQEAIWRKYILESLAGYKVNRYGGPLTFSSMEDYCQKLSEQEVVVGPKLVRFEEVDRLDVPLFLRSIWWYFRLKRYGNDMCIEVRPMPRREDGTFEMYLEKILEILK